MNTENEEKTEAYNMREITNNVIGDFLYDQASGNAGTLSLIASLLYLNHVELVHIHRKLENLEEKVTLLQNHCSALSSQKDSRSPE